MTTYRTLFAWLLGLLLIASLAEAFEISKNYLPERAFPDSIKRKKFVPAGVDNDTVERELRSECGSGPQGAVIYQAEKYTMSRDYPSVSIPGYILTFECYYR